MPVSHLDTVLLVTPSFSPSCSCVSFCFFLSSAIKFPILIKSICVTSGIIIAIRSIFVFPTDRESLDIPYLLPRTTIKRSARIKNNPPIPSITHPSIPSVDTDILENKNESINKRAATINHSFFFCFIRITPTFSSLSSFYFILYLFMISSGI